MLINKSVLVSGAEYFDDGFAINPYMDAAVAVNIQRAQSEHASVVAAFKTAGIDVHTTPAPPDCQDGVYTANWALCRGDIAVLSSLPNKRRPEQTYARKALEQLGKTVIEPPCRFSGQGDALPCGNFLLAGTGYRSDAAVHEFLARTLGYEVVPLQTIPAIDEYEQPITNTVTGWPDSLFYDIDLAMAVLRPDLIAWCPEAFVPASQAIIRNLPLDKIEVSLAEATEGFACNLVSTGETVIMSAHAPQLQAAIEARGLKTLTPEVNELAKGGGYIRCISLTLDNT